MQILLVEDDQTLFQQLKKELENWDFFVYGVNDFSNVMETYHNVQPEIVIMDVQLPKYDGFYWCRQIRQVSNVPILFLSSRDNPMDQVMSMELGADDYMQKPFHTNVLIAKLQAIYRRVYQFGAEERRTLWDDEAFVSDNTLTVNVNRLRKKLSEIGMETEIETKVGKGYMAHE